jgi:hypothetical protein
VISTKLKPTSAALATIAQSAASGPHDLRNALSAALATSDTINKKPIPRIMLSESSRVRNSVQTPD